MAKNIILQKELDNIKKTILSLGSMVEERVHMAIGAMEKRDYDQAVRIIEMDREVDEREIEVEEECLKILALHQPVAVDLRFLIAVIKINNELERIADQAKNISRRVKHIAKGAAFEFEFDYTPVAEKAVSMVKQSLDSLVNLDGDLAYKVRLRDDEVDEAIQSAYHAVQQAIRKSPENVNELINMLLISRHLERIADHSTNIAEEVIYLIEGEIVRHGKY